MPENMPDSMLKNVKTEALEICCASALAEIFSDYAEASIGQVRAKRVLCKYSPLQC